MKQPTIKDRVFTLLNNRVDKGQGVSQEDTSALSLYIASIIGCKVTTVERYFRAYKASKIETSRIKFNTLPNS